MQKIIPYLPPASINLVNHQFSTIRVNITITRKRATKHGDYRQPEKGVHRISINQTLNQYAFLITLLHELAHAQCTEQYGRRAKPHGREWKTLFRDLLLPHVMRNVFPVDLAIELQRHLKNPKASSSSDHGLTRCLRKYDEGDPKTLLDDLSVGDTFLLGRARIFEKGVKKRTRHLCKELQNGRQYLISGIAEVQLIEPVKPF